jgi:hypothetical protein
VEEVQQFACQRDICLTIHGDYFYILISFAHNSFQIGLILTALIWGKVFFGKLVAVQEVKFHVFHGT